MKDKVHAVSDKVPVNFPQSPLYGSSPASGKNFTSDLPRGCTDVICCILFAAFLAAWIVIGVFAYMWGDPQKLVYPTDSLGRICGATTVFYNLSSKPYLFFFDMTDCFDYTTVIEGCSTPQVCIEKCPDSYFYFDLPTNQFSLDDLKSRLICTDDVDKRKIKTFQDAKLLVQQKLCASYYISSLPMVGRCVPAGIVNGWNELERAGLANISSHGGDTNMTAKYRTDEATNFVKVVLEAKGIGEKILADLQIAWWQILTCLLISAIVAFLWIFIMRWVAGFMVWLSIFLVVSLLAAACAICWWKYVTMKAMNANDDFKFTLKLSSYVEMPTTWLVLAIIVSVILGITLLVLIFLFSRIRLAIALIVESSRAVSCMISTLFFPVVPYVLHLGVFTFWATVAVYLASSGRPQCRIIGLSVDYRGPLTNHSLCSCDDLLSKNSTADGYCKFMNYTTDPNVFKAQIFNLFGLFWGMFFVSALGDVTLAGAFASYYWAFRKPQDVPSLPLFKAFYRAVRYHLGSIAFGSLIIAIVKMIQVALEALEKKLKTSKNPVAEGLLKCFKCLFWCLEKFLRFLNKNAYIMIAIYGRNFCASAKEAFSLLMRNVVRVVVLDKCTDFVLFLGKLVITLGAGVGSFYYFSGRITVAQELVQSLNYYYLPIIIVIVGTFVICSAFFGVYEMAVDTTFLCFLEDSERNDGSVDKPYFMSDALKRLLHKENQAPKQVAMN